MAGTTTSSRRTAVSGSDVNDLTIQFNKVVDDVETLRAVSAESNTLIAELHDDHATNKTIIDELKTDYTALLADVTAIRTALLALTAKLDLDGGVSGTDFAATVDPAALTASAIAASSAATLTASKPTAANVNTASDLTAAKIGNDQGTAISA